MKDADTRKLRRAVVKEDWANESENCVLLTKAF